MIRVRAVAALSALGLLVAACGGASGTTESAAAGNPDVAESTVAFDGVFKTVSGAQIDFGSLEGQDTVLWFWAPW